MCKSAHSALLHTLQYVQLALHAQSNSFGISLFPVLHCIQQHSTALHMFCTVHKWYCVQHCTEHKLALCTKLHCIQDCTLHCTQVCTVRTAHKKLHYVPKQIFLGCGHFGSPSLSCSRTFTLPDSSTCAPATQLSIACAMCSTAILQEQLIDCKPLLHFTPYHHVTILKGVQQGFDMGYNRGLTGVDTG